MIKLLRLPGKRHQPDIEALSAHLDGRLDAARDVALSSHVASCEACRTVLDEMRRTQAVLRRMPMAEAPRSFRLRPSDVAADVPTGSRAPTSPVLRWSPALAGVAFAVFAVVLGADLATRGGGGGSLASRESDQRTGTILDDATFSQESAKDGGAGVPGPEGPAGGIQPPDTGTSIAAAAPFDASTQAPLAAAPTPDVTQTPPEAVIPADTAAEPPGPGEDEADATAPEAATEAAPTGPPPDGDEELPPPDAPLPADDGLTDDGRTTDGSADATPLAGDAAVRPDGPAPAPSAPTGEVTALSSDNEGGDDGNRTAFLIVEIAAAIAAVVSGGTFVAWRSRRREEP